MFQRNKDLSIMPTHARLTHNNLLPRQLMIPQYSVWPVPQNVNLGLIEHHVVEDDTQLDVHVYQFKFPKYKAARSSLSRTFILNFLCIMITAAIP